MIIINEIKKVHCFGLDAELGEDIEAVVEEDEIDFLCLWQVNVFLWIDLFIGWLFHNCVCSFWQSKGSKN